MIKGTQKLLEEMEVALDAMVGRGPATEAGVGDQPSNARYKPASSTTDLSQRDEKDLTPKDHAKISLHHDKMAHVARKKGDYGQEDHHQGLAYHHEKMAKGRNSEFVKDVHGNIPGPKDADGDPMYSMSHNADHDDWFDGLSDDSKKHYLELHPNSKYAKGKQESNKNSKFNTESSDSDFHKELEKANKKTHRIEDDWHYPILHKFGWKPDKTNAVGFVRTYKYSHPDIDHVITATTGANADHWSSQSKYGYAASLEPYLKELSKKYAKGKSESKFSMLKMIRG